MVNGGFEEDEEVSVWDAISEGGWNSLYIRRGSKNPLQLPNPRASVQHLNCGDKVLKSRRTRHCERGSGATFFNFRRTRQCFPGHAATIQGGEGNERDNLGKFQALLHFWDLLQRNRKTRVFHAQSDFRFKHSVFRFYFAILSSVLQQFGYRKNELEGKFVDDLMIWKFVDDLMYVIEILKN